MTDKQDKYYTYEEYLAHFRGTADRRIYHRCRCNECKAELNSGPCTPECRKKDGHLCGACFAKMLADETIGIICEALK